MYVRGIIRNYLDTFLILFFKVLHSSLYSGTNKWEQEQQIPSTVREMPVAAPSHISRGW